LAPEILIGLAMIIIFHNSEPDSPLNELILIIVLVAFEVLKIIVS